MIVNFFEYILVTLLAGLGSFGGGLGGVNILKEFAMGWMEKVADNFGGEYALMTDPELFEQATAIMADMEGRLLNIATLSQFGGYAQGITLATYLGGYTQLGIFGGILGAVAFMLPSVVIVAVILKIGEKLYKNPAFKYSIKYINLLAAGLICMIAWNYVGIIFGIDPIIYVAVAGLACFCSIYFNLSPVIVVAAGGVIGLIWRA